MEVAKGFEELERISAWFEGNETDLDQGLMKFERAMQIADSLKKRLSQAESRVQEIKKKFNPGSDLP